MRTQKMISLDSDIKEFIDDNMQNFNFSNWVNERFRSEYMDAENIQKAILENKKLLKKAKKTDTSFKKEFMNEEQKNEYFERLSRGFEPKRMYEQFLSSTGTKGAEFTFKDFAKVLLEEQKRRSK